MSRKNISKKYQIVALSFLFLIASFILIDYNIQYFKKFFLESYYVAFFRVASFLFLLNCVSLLLLTLNPTSKNYKKLVFAITFFILIGCAFVIFNALLGWGHNLEKYLMRSDYDIITMHDLSTTVYSAGLLLLFNFSILLHNTKNKKLLYVRNWSVIIVLVMASLYMVSYSENSSQLFEKTHVLSVLYAIFLWSLSILYLSIIDFNTFPLIYFSGNSPEKNLIRFFAPSLFIFILLYNTFKTFLLNNEVNFIINYLFVFFSIVIGLIVVVVTSKLFEKDLTRFKNYHKETLDNLLEGFSGTAFDGTLLSYNKEFVRIFDLDSAVNHLGINVIDLWADPKQRELYVTQLKKEGYIKDFVAAMKKMDGTKIIVRISSRLCSDKNGELLKIECVFQDVSEQFKLKNELEESEEKFKALVVNNEEIIFSFNSDGTILLLEGLGLEKMELNQNQLVGKNIFELCKDYPKITEDIKRALHGEKVISETKVGTESFKTIFAPYLDMNTNKYFILGMGINISELKQAKEKAEESNRLKSAFLANMSHEIRTPMNAILGFCEIVESKDLSESKKEGYYKLIHKSGNRLLDIISDIIDISKIESNQIKIELKPCNLNLLLKNLKSQFNLSKKNTVTLMTKFALPDNGCAIITDEDRLTQVISNILENAYKFTEEGIIEFGYALMENEIRFYVKDYGIGIKAKDHQFIFERFGQSESGKEKAKEGTGLGLSISKGIIEALGGNIWVESELLKGATFYFTIPYCVSENNALEIEESKDNTAQGLNRTTNQTILIAEDEESNYCLLEAILENLDFKLIHANNGKEAVEMFQNNAVDIILMDFNMPVMNGLDATIEIRKMDESIPIIALTANVMDEDKEEAFAIGCNDFLSKPVKRHVLLATMNKHLNQVLK